MGEHEKVSSSLKPGRKVTAAAVGAALATAVVLILQMVGTEVPVGLEGALATIFAFAAGYVTPEG